MSGKLMVMGDFNFHYENPDLHDTKKLHDLLYSLNLEQHVHEPTHIRGYCLDLVISRSDEIDVTCVDVHPPSISDHSIVTLKNPRKTWHIKEKETKLQKTRRHKPRGTERRHLCMQFCDKPEG